MNRTARFTLWTIVFVFIFLISVGFVLAQKGRSGAVAPMFAADTSMYPHDFTNEYYEMNGIVGKAILNRRTGSDGLSIFGKSSNPIHTDVQVIGTIPAYDQRGDILFWYPLGQIEENGFTTEKMGWEMREIAKLYPIYVFPHTKIQDYRTFENTRQAALMDNTWSMILGANINPLGVRQIMFVSFTDKAFTQEGAELMDMMSKKNGIAADDTPMLKTLDDIRLMMKYELVSLEPVKGYENRYAISPMLSDPTNGLIASEAFLWFATKDGSPLPTERMFVDQFNCLQKTGNWCKE